MDIRDILARNIKRIRLEQGFSQEELAHRADMTAPISARLNAAFMPPALMWSGGSPGGEGRPSALLAKPIKSRSNRPGSK